MSKTATISRGNVSGSAKAGRGRRVSGDVQVRVPESNDTIRVQLRDMQAAALMRWARKMRATYDAAATSTDNARHWANADTLSANSANSPAVRATLRKRSRYEVANNTYAKHIVRTLANHTIGTGPRLQVLDVPKADVKWLQREFAAWAKEVRLGAKLRLLRQEKAVNGESLAVLTTNPNLEHAITMDVVTVEVDRLTDGTGTLLDPRNIDGVMLDAWQTPATYRILRQHPGEYGYLLRPDDYDDIPARSVCHWYPLDRSGQHRGVPEITPALPLFAQLRRYTLAVIAAAEAVANVAGTIESDAAAEEADDVSPMDTIEMEKAMLLTLPAGWKMRQVQAEQPTTTYAEFKREVLKEIAASVDMPYNIAAGDSSDYNFASGQLDHQVYVSGIWVERQDCEDVCLQKIIRQWLAEARSLSKVESYLPRSLMAGSVRIEWHWDSVDLGDPLKRANVRDMELKNGSRTLARTFAEDGLDWGDEVEQRAIERDKLAEKGLPMPWERPAGAPQASQEPQDGGEGQPPKKGSKQGPKQQQQEPADA